MTLTRADIVAHLSDALAHSIAQAHIATNDEPGGLRGPIDQMLRKLGVAHTVVATATVADDDVDAALAIAEYYTLVRVRERVRTRWVSKSMSDPSVSKSLSDALRDLADDIKEKKAAAEQYVSLDGSGWAGVAVYSTDYIEPEEATA